MMHFRRSELSSFYYRFFILMLHLNCRFGAVRGVQHAILIFKAIAMLFLFVYRAITGFSYPVLSGITGQVCPEARGEILAQNQSHSRQDHLKAF